MFPDEEKHYSLLVTSAFQRRKAHPAAHFGPPCGRVVAPKVTMTSTPFFLLIPNREAGLLSRRGARCEGFLHLPPGGCRSHFRSGKMVSLVVFLPVRRELNARHGCSGLLRRFDPTPFPPLSLVAGAVANSGGSSPACCMLVGVWASVEVVSQSLGLYCHLILHKVTRSSDRRPLWSCWYFTLHCFWRLTAIFTPCGGLCAWTSRLFPGPVLIRTSHSKGGQN